MTAGGLGSLELVDGPDRSGGRERMRALAEAALGRGPEAVLEFKLACSPSRILSLLRDLDAAEQRLRELEPVAARGQHLRDYQREWSSRKRAEAQGAGEVPPAADQDTSGEMPTVEQLQRSLEACRDALKEALRETNG